MCKRPNVPVFPSLLSTSIKQMHFAMNLEYLLVRTHACRKVFDSTWSTSLMSNTAVEVLVAGLVTFKSMRHDIWPTKRRKKSEQHALLRSSD